MGNVRVILSLEASTPSRRRHSHIEGPSTAFGTSLNYCAIRILGMSADHPVAVKARVCLHTLGQFAARLLIAAPAHLSFLLLIRLCFGRTRLG